MKYINPMSMHVSFAVFLVLLGCCWGLGSVVSIVSWLLLIFVSLKSISILEGIKWLMFVGPDAMKLECANAKKAALQKRPDNAPCGYYWLVFGIMDCRIRDNVNLAVFRSLYYRVSRLVWYYIAIVVFLPGYFYSNWWIALPVCGLSVAVLIMLLLMLAEIIVGLQLLGSKYSHELRHELFRSEVAAVGRIQRAILFWYGFFLPMSEEAGSCSSVDYEV